MKKIVFITIIVSLCMAGCSDRQSDFIEIRDRMFIGQINEIYMNADNYLGKTIQLEGVLQRYSQDEKNFHYVIRYGPNCCGDDGVIGFEVAWSTDQIFPEPESWVQARGVLTANRTNEQLSYLYLDLTSLTELDKRGRAFVNR